MDIKSIDTYYKGFKFRSRTEARWAVFFDAMGYNWQYESEGYNLNGVNYLPDFYFPEIHSFAEVKGNKFTDDERQKCRLLSMMNYTNSLNKKDNFSVILLDGQPSCKSYELYIGGSQVSDLIFIPKGEKFYPFYYGYDFDEYFDTTELCVMQALSKRFEFNGK